MRKCIGYDACSDTMTDAIQKGESLNPLIINNNATNIANIPLHKLQPY